MVHDVLIPEEERKEEIEMNDEVNEGIINNKLHTVTDTSVLHNQMGSYLKIVNFENQIIMSKEIFNKKWDVNSPKYAEAAIMLDMLEVLKEHTMTQLEGELIFINDNKLLHNDIHEK